MKPVSGGRPPKDRRSKGARAVRAGAFVQEVASILMLVASFNLNTINVEDVMMIYVASAIRVKEGENCITSTIQPRWAIEE